MREAFGRRDAIIIAVGLASAAVLIYLGPPIDGPSIVARIVSGIFWRLP